LKGEFPPGRDPNCRRGYTPEDSRFLVQFDAAAVVATTTLLTVLQYRRPEIRLALWRDPEQLRAGQWWRLLSALFVQYDAAWMIVVVLVLITAVGVLASVSSGTSTGC